MRRCRISRRRHPCSSKRPPPDLDPSAQASVPRATADTVVSAVFAVIADALQRNNTVAVSGFGTFSTLARAEHQGRNPRTGESIAIAASKAPALKAAKTLRDTISGRS